MNRFELKESTLGKFKTIKLIDNSYGSQLEIALKGATPRSFKLPVDGKLFDVLDGFRTEEELEIGRGARNWIMTPFANRVKDGKYFFNGVEHILLPVAPRDYVIHGYTSHQFFEIENVETNDEFIKVVLVNRSIRPGVYRGYPFALDVFVSFKLSGAKVSIKVDGKNSDDKPLPFFCGWHPYFKTSDKGIEHLIMTVDAKSNILMDEKFFPFDGEKAFAPIENYPLDNYTPRITIQKRIINNRVIDNCFADLNFNDEGFATSYLFDPENGLEISVFQKSGVTLVFTGDSLKERKRQSVAIEPMQSLTNTFNRPELMPDFTIEPGASSIFEFGFEIKRK
ncbi:MAG: aldose 1-epimerase [Ignavibacteriaceae bacterium]|nr:aldose 1-epimerase [Ignavibacteriaceae bacterium]